MNALLFADCMKHKIAIAQVNPIVGDISGNVGKIKEYISKARKKGADIVIFPEQVVTGYPAQDLLLHNDFILDVMAANEELAKAAKDITVIYGTVELGEQGDAGKSLYNVAKAVRDGEVIGTQAKSLLPTYDVFYEQRYFAPAKTVEPINIDGVKYGVHICEDMWDEFYKRKVVDELVEKGADVLVNISASPFYLNKRQVRFGLIERHAKKAPFIYVNMVGAQDELIFDGGSMAYENGKIMQLPLFEESLSLVDCKNDSLEKIVTEEQAFKGLVLGVRDYFRKNGMKKAVLGLSGGIDSALTAVIAAEALGRENVMTLGLPSKFSTSHSIDDAKCLAGRLGVKYEIVPIGEMYNSVMKGMVNLFAGIGFDVTEENIQARLRMVALMAYANKNNALVLNTGDKSEVALGYCTMYGDMSGALSVISDLTKPEVYAVSRWYNNLKGEIIPNSTLTKPPSPELRSGQVAPFDYERLSPLLEQMTERIPIQTLEKRGFSRKDILMAYSKWKFNEFKRWQSPIALKLKPVSFGRGRMYPVTNGYVPTVLLEELAKSRQDV